MFPFSVCGRAVPVPFRTFKVAACPALELLSTGALYCSGLLYFVNLVDLSRTNFVVYSELLLALTSLLRFNRFFVVHLWSGFCYSTLITAVFWMHFDLEHCQLLPN